MIAVVRDWIVNQLELGEFQSYGEVCRKSVVAGIKVSVLAYTLNLLCHLVMHQAGILPYDPKPALIMATVLTPPITFIVSVIFYIAVGAAIHDLGVSRARLEQLSQTDMLTGIPNRRAFQTAFDISDGDKSMAVFDVDRFKIVNDTHGHSVGDMAIVHVAKVLSSVFGGRGICARIGGEEFGVLCTDGSFSEFAASCELACRKIAGERIDAETGAFTVTVSGGVAMSVAGEGFSQAFTRADKALYAAKAGGRNRIVLSCGADHARSEAQVRDGDTTLSAA